MQVWNNGALIAILPDVISVKCAALPPTHRPTVTWLVDADIYHRRSYSEPVNFTVDVTTYSGTKLRVQTATCGPPLTALTGERIEAVHAEALAVSALDPGPPQYLLEVPEIGPAGIPIRSGGPAGVLESSPSLIGPWTPVPDSKSGEITLPVGGSPAQFFRVRSQQVGRGT